MIKIHDTAKVSPKCDIEDSIRGSSIEIGAFSNIDSFVKFFNPYLSVNLMIRH